LPVVGLDKANPWALDFNGRGSPIHAAAHKIKQGSGISWIRSAITTGRREATTRK
jgi:hypothetical protein